MFDYDKLPEALQKAYLNNPSFKKIVDYATIRNEDYSYMLEMALEFFIEENESLTDSLVNIRQLNPPPLVLVTSEEERERILNEYRNKGTEK